MSRLFDTVVVVDWSARSVPSPAGESPDAVWVGVVRAGEGEAPRYFRTRHAAMDFLADLLAGEGAAGRRVLAGFDFPFGYPQGFAREVAGRADALALWDFLAARIEDAPDNANNRLDVAARINRMFPQAGPFWGRARSQIHDGLEETRPDPALMRFPEFRLTERIARGARSPWQLAYAGSVGGQALLGIPALRRLRADPRLAGGIAVWPFESGLRVPRAPVVLAEVYPALLAAAVAAAGDPIRDRAQVRLLAAALAALDAEGGLAALFATELDPAGRDAVEREEGWILGAGHARALRAGAAAAEARGPAPPLRNDCFALPPGVDWVPVDAALARLRDGLAPVAGIETVPLIAGAGRILAQPLRAGRAHPPHPNAAVDGYGFAHASLGSGPHALPLVAGRAAAGRPYGDAVPAGHAIRILTGAMLPAGVDTVVLEEDTARAEDRVRFDRGLKPGANTRAAGEDVAAGALLFEPGRLLAPQDLALAAACGVTTVTVRRPLRVAVLSTGDELAASGAAALPHQIHDANRPMLLALARRWSMEPVDLGQAADDPAALAAALDRGAATADAVLTSGGASAGDEDHVSRTLRARGTLQTWRVAMKPGRPLALGLWGGIPVFGLPGNPVAAFVCSLVFARPALMLLAGAPWALPQGLSLPAAFEKSKKAGRREYLRARLDAAGRVEAFRSEGSGRISGLAWASGLVELGDGALAIRRGDPVRFLPFAEFGL